MIEIVNANQLLSYCCIYRCVSNIVKSFTYTGKLCVHEFLEMRIVRTIYIIFQDNKHR